MKNLIGIFLFVVSFQFNAQTSGKTSSESKFKVEISTDKSVRIEFPVDKNVYNVLVLLVDDAGNTVFLDDQYNFKGIYKRSVDLSRANKGVYFLKISNDDEVVTRKLNLE